VAAVIKRALPTASEERKDVPLDAVFEFFPAALVELARCIKVGAEQHCEGRLEWDRSKSTDHVGCWLRHNLDRRENDRDTDGVLHLAKMAWRSLALLQLKCEELGAPVAPGAVNLDVPTNAHWKEVLKTTYGNPVPGSQTPLRRAVNAGAFEPWNGPNIIDPCTCHLTPGPENCRKHPMGPAL
jgi:hypothetical protein